MATHYLDNQSLENFDFDIISLTCSDSIYRLIFELNQELNIDLQLSLLLDYSFKNEMYYFPVYSFTHHELNMEFNLIPNQTSFQEKNSTSNLSSFDLFAGDVEKTIRFLPEFENADYFLLLKGETRFIHNSQIIESIRRIPIATFVKEIFLDDIKDIKMKSNLLF